MASVLNGMPVFLVAVPLILFLSGTGLGSILGILGNFTGALNIDPHQVQAPNVNPPNVQQRDVVAAAQAARNASWLTLLGPGLGVGASTLGGAMGTHRKLEVDRSTGNISE